MPRLEDFSFDVEQTLASVVAVRTSIPHDAYTASRLGTERAGSGVVIGSDGLIVTVNYLLTEAESIWVIDNTGKALPAQVIGQDQDSGFGLVQPLQHLNRPPLSIGKSCDAIVGDKLILSGFGGIKQAQATRIIAKQEFAGYWEYLLDEALFTAPAHPQWGGAALLDPQGDLIGTGSLLVQQEVKGESIHVNMFVPIDLLAPILDAMLKTGRGPNPPHPWLGMYTQDPEGKLVVGTVTTGGPAERAGVRAGDMVLGVGVRRVHGLIELFRAIRKLGPAGVDVPLMLARAGDVLRITVKSADRDDFLKKPNLH